MVEPEVIPLKAALGARVQGLDRSTVSAPEIAALLDHALAEHLLVVVPGDRMTPEQMRDFSMAFGTPQKQLLRYKRSGPVPEVSIMVSTLMDDGSTDKTALRAEDWHTDDSYMAIPAKATLLHSIEIPSRGGTTWFCNMHSVYESLPEATRRRIDGLRAIHSYDTARARNRPSQRTDQEIAETPDVEHPLVRTHPGTGRKALYLNFNRLDRIVGLEREESDDLLDQLAEEARKPEHHFGHRWSVGDVVIWDNRATMHRVDVDYPVGERRIMQRVLIEGDKPF
ncbi:taurine dioxygenase [Enhydrobacter aerosaccus]|uniref:Taurine dioxygenase n=1 Tax=Enhydrobacter aerosaccus TaxID=225324 RepID=A0A1T4KVQ0_9HYPH|nr:TauD/TfdA family dioxygenase [Enhydrobacter aerosaccus]SJZ46428.1 taurine dioxygenase [Enhydrobacter aerosaccus]